MSAKPAYTTIDDRIANQIRDAHRRHPNLGAKGLLNVLKQSGAKVDAKELEAFMKEEGMKPSTAKKAWGGGRFSAPWDR